MKIKRNKYIPFKGFGAINLFGVIYARDWTYISEQTYRHELIHTAQMKELWYIPFYIWYGVEWFVRLFIYCNWKKAYYNILFEREAFQNDKDLTYLDNRKNYSWYKYLKQ